MVILLPPAPFMIRALKAAWPRVEASPSGLLSVHPIFQHSRSSRRLIGKGMWPYAAADATAWATRLEVGEQVLLDEDCARLRSTWTCWITVER